MSNVLQNTGGSTLKALTGGGYGSVASSPPSSGDLLFTPDYLIDAESATLGQTYSGSGTDQWTDASGGTTAQNVEVLHGTKAWEMSIAQGTDGWGNWGGRKYFDTPVTRYGVVHAQWSVFFPVGFDWSATSFLKFFRFLVATSSSAALGHIDMYIHSGDHGFGAEADGLLALHSEVQDTFDHIFGETMQKGVWETFEMEVTMDTVTVDSGGQARTRIWRNKSGVMTLIVDNTDHITMQNVDDQLESILYFTYWNGNSPATQICYADRVVVQIDQSKLVETDAAGNKIIGGLL